VDILQLIVDYLNVDAYAYLGGAVVFADPMVMLLLTRESAFGGRFVCCRTWACSLPAWRWRCLVFEFDQSPGPGPAEPENARAAESATDRADGLRRLSGEPLSVPPRAAAGTSRSRAAGAFADGWR